MKLAAILIAGSLLAGCSGLTQPERRRVVIAVTDQGFVPEQVTVQTGEPITLVVTRKTQTAAEELVIPDSGIRRDLEVGEPIEIQFTPEAAGRIEFTSANLEHTGMILVEERG